MSDNAQIRDWYLNNISEYQQQSRILQKKWNGISTLRLLVFVFFLALSGISFYFNWWTGLPIIVFLFALAFGKLINIHNSIKTKKKHFDLLVEINDNELKRLSLELHTFDDGSQYSVPDHSYCVDLDLFGPHSLFQWLNRTVTNAAEQLLAKSLLNLPLADEVIRRQQSVKELSAKAEWAQNFLAGGLAFKQTKANVNMFLKWVSKISALPWWLKPSIAIFPPLALLLTVAYFAGWISGNWVILVLGINGFLLYLLQPLAKQNYQQTHRSINTLRSYEAMIASVEGTDFSSNLLQELKMPFVDKKERASKTIRQLKNLLSRIETRQNSFYWIANVYFLLDFIWLIQANHWKSNHGDHVNGWFRSLNYFEVLVSLGLTAHSQNTLGYPELTDNVFEFKAANLGHPLIKADERVSNDFVLETKGTVVVLTGSNMSGKSTFLRTIGVNIVLARLGAPVCADRLILGNFLLYTSMRTTDSLEQHVSSFYAELARINKLIRILDQRTATMFLLDELLKGTNSHDRNLGSTALIKQLGKSPAFGLISTHDLALGALSDKWHNIKNFSFNSEFKNGKIFFDYKLRTGLCKSFNAAELMSQMGIDLKFDQRV